MKSYTHIEALEREWSIWSIKSRSLEIEYKGGENPPTQEYS
jgi:hypothetical protein